MLFSATAAAGGAAGALIGGVLVQYASWRWIMFINVPIGVLLFIAAFLFLKESRAEDAGKLSIDFMGAITITGGLASLVYGVASSELNGWVSWTTFWSFFIAVALLAAFCIIETRIVAKPLVPFSIFKIRSVLGANIVIFFFGVSMFTMWFFMSLWEQNVLLLTPLYTGLSFIPNTVCIAGAAITAGKLAPKYGPRNFLMAGGFLGAVGMLWLGFLKHTDSYWSGIFGPGVLASLGVSTHLYLYKCCAVE